MEEIKSNTKTLELTGEETQVHFTSAFPYFWVWNVGSGTVLMSVFPNISEGKDGVIEVLAGSSAGTMHGYSATCNDLYLRGSGKVQVMGTYTPENPFRKAQKGGEGNVIKLGGLVEHTTGSQGWYIKTNGCSETESVPEHNIVYYAVAEHLQIYIKAEDDSNECKFIWSKSDKRDVTSTYPNKDMIGTPVTDVIDGFVTVPAGAKWICFSQKIIDTETGVYKLS